MKITRKQLRQIIKEELGKLPKRSIAHGPGEGIMHTINNEKEAIMYRDEIMSALTISQKDLTTGNKGKNDTRDQQDEALLNDLMSKMDVGIYPFDIPLGIRS